MTPTDPKADMHRRLLLAVTLSILVMLVYPAILAKLFPSLSAPRQTLQETQPLAPQHVMKPKVYNEKAYKKITLNPENARYCSLTTDRYDISLSNIGGGINKIELRDGRGFSILLVDNATLNAGILAIEGTGPMAGLSSQPFEITEDRRTLCIQTEGLRVEKRLSFVKDAYALQATITLTNLQDIPQTFSFEVTTGANISKKEIYESRYIVSEVLYADGRLKKIAGGNFKKTSLLSKNIKWLSLRNKYYSIIARPEFNPSGVFVKKIEGNGVVGFIVNNENLLPGQSKSYRLLFYIGPTELSELQKVEESFGRALNFGIFTSISLILLSILKFFYGLFHNYGISILLLTFCVSLGLFPLSFKSLKSMRKLQELQPHIEKVRAQYKDNPHKLNKEIMEIYRRYKVNPMSGCLPIFFQMPIFIALYQTLMKSVELKGAGFLWIKDLSRPDAAFKLPFTLPILGSAINILPILMIGAMILQQKVSQGKTASVQTEQQKMMTMVMPVVFGFIFYSLPSGLVLYWLTNTLITGSLQFIILRKR